MKHARKPARKFGTKALLAALSFALVLCTVIGGTVAWLVDYTDTVTNTFTYGDINIDLKETTGDTYEMMPGNDIAKDPVISVDVKSEDSWLFVKLEESANLKDFLTYAIADGWTQLKDANDQDVKGVYYRTVDAGDAAAATGFAILKDNKVSVLGTVTKAQLNALTTATMPTLSFTGYAVQRDNNFTTAIAAWNAITAQVAADQNP